MPDCPNCGLDTLRTKDWVCQWCGYPLLSGSYKTIDKTYKELQDERASAETQSPAPTQSQSKSEYRPKPVPKTEQPEQPAYEMPHASASPPQSQPEVESTPTPETPVQPQPEMTTPPVSETPVESEPDVAEPTEAVTPEQPQPEAETPPVSETPPSQTGPTDQPPPQGEVTPESTPADTPQPVSKNPLPPQTKPEFNVEPEPTPDYEIELSDIEDGMEIAVEQIDVLFKKQQEAAHTAFTNKTFIIQGIIEKVFIREHLGIRYILLTGIMKGITWSLRCTFEKENARALSGLQEGQAVKIKGKYDGYGKNIIFKDCALA